MNQDGFTMVEIVAVLIILGIIAAISIPKIMSMDKRAEMIGMEMVVNELNSREMKCWTEAKFTNDGWKNDDTVYSTCNYTLENYEWLSINGRGGALKFGSTTVGINRTDSERNNPGSWRLTK